MMICVTMFNEEFKELDDTLRGIAGIILSILLLIIENMDNLHLAYDLTPEEVAVFVVIDGRNKVSPTLFHVYNNIYILLIIYTNRKEKMKNII